MKLNSMQIPLYKIARVRSTGTVLFAHQTHHRTVDMRELRCISVVLLLLRLCCGSIHETMAEEVYNVSSPEFKAIAAETYRKVIPCLESAWMLADRQEHRDWKFPDDAQEHFEKILEVTEQFRRIAVHEYAGYEGPWIENMFITKFMPLPLHKYRGMIPIFVQWIDSQILRGRLFGHIQNTLAGILRPNVIYLAISQGDVGLGQIGRALPNIFVMSAGGYGHSIIPLIKGEIEQLPHREEFVNDVAFFGNVRQPPRPTMLPEMETISQELGLRFKTGQGPTWVQDMNETKFNLAPRGYGRSSFRFAEAIQMGRMPVFLYDDVPWIPYQGTNISAETFGLVGRKSNDGVNTLSKVLHDIKNMTDVEYRQKLQHLLTVRNHYTYRGVFRQIAMWLNDPFGPNGGHLRCTYHPRNERCCG